MRISPRDDGIPAGRTGTDGQAGIIKNQSLPGNVVEIGSPDIRVAIYSEVLCRYIVGNYKNKIGRNGISFVFITTIQ